MNTYTDDFISILKQLSNDGFFEVSETDENLKKAKEGIDRVSARLSKSYDNVERERANVKELEAKLQEARKRLEGLYEDHEEVLVEMECAKTEYAVNFGMIKAREALSVDMIKNMMSLFTIQKTKQIKL